MSTRVTTPLDILANDPTEEEKSQAIALAVAWSKKFADYGDPRQWDERNLVMGDVQDFAWLSGTSRMVAVACFDQWVAGDWNDIDGVEKPAEPR